MNVSWVGKSSKPGSCCCSYSFKNYRHKMDNSEGFSAGVTSPGLNFQLHHSVTLSFLSSLLPSPGLYSGILKLEAERRRSGQQCWPVLCSSTRDHSSTQATFMGVHWVKKPYPWPLWAVLDGLSCSFD